jgi:hypothetical protein
MARPFQNGPEFTELWGHSPVRPVLVLANKKKRERKIENHSPKKCIYE